MTPPRRVLVAGVTGVGKTTLARRIAAALDLEHVEVDALHHGPAWTPRAEFLADVRALAARESWVAEWQYDAARPMLLERAELLVWLDLPVSRAMAQLVRRTLVRRLRREELWHGNVEPPLCSILTDPDHVVRWGWRTRRRYRELVPAARAARPDLAVVRLGSHDEAGRWLASLAEQPGQGRSSPNV